MTQSHDKWRKSDRMARDIRYRKNKRLAIHKLLQEKISVLKLGNGVRG